MKEIELNIPKQTKEYSQLWVIPAMLLAIYLQTITYQWIWKLMNN